MGPSLGALRCDIGSWSLAGQSMLLCNIECILHQSGLSSKQTPFARRSAMAQGPEQLAGWQKAAIDTSIACAQAALAGAEQLLQLNLDAARTALEQHAQATRALLGTTDPQELMRLRSRLAQQTMQQAASYAQDVYDLVSATHAQFAQHTERQLAGFNEDLVTRAEQA